MWIGRAKDNAMERERRSLQDQMMDWSRIPGEIGEKQKKQQWKSYGSKSKRIPSRFARCGNNSDRLSTKFRDGRTTQSGEGREKKNHPQQEYHPQQIIASPASFVIKRKVGKGKREKPSPAGVTRPLTTF